MSYTNRPIAPSPDTITEWLLDNHIALLQRRDEILGGYKRFLEAYPAGIPDETVQARAADFAGGKGIMAAFVKEAESARTTEKKPYIAGGKAVETFFGELTDPVERCQKDMRARMTTFANKLEAERREAARLEAERLAIEAQIAQDAATDDESLEVAADVTQAAEAAAALAEAKPSVLSQTRGELGTVVSLRTTWRAAYEEANLMELVQAVARGEAPIEYLQFNEVRVNYAIRSEKVRKIPGIPVVEVRTVV